MSISFVLRLVPGLPAGRLVGEAVDVASGELAPIHDVEELLAFVTRFLSPPIDPIIGATLPPMDGS